MQTSFFFFFYNFIATLMRSTLVSITIRRLTFTKPGAVNRNRGAGCAGQPMEKEALFKLLCPRAVVATRTLCQDLSINKDKEVWKQKGKCRFPDSPYSH